MGDDYLWDGSGTPDPEVARLEGLLGEYRYAGTAPERRSRGPLWGGLLLAALVVLGVGIALWSRTGSAGWELSSPGCASCRLAVGEWLEPDEVTRLVVADIGHIDVQPDARVRIKATGPDEHRLELAEGAIHAAVLAPPRLLVVETPAATAVDLGCEYDLVVDAAGEGTLTVTSGWVALESPLGTTTVPQDSWAPIHAGRAPGLPRQRAASAAFSEAADRAETAPAAAMEDLLRLARRQDTLTLFHLLPRLQSRDHRERVLREIERLGPGRTDRMLDREKLLDADGPELERLMDVLWGCCLR